jgi:pimeloyl-ACP methyl ester carboxylesterase
MISFFNSPRGKKEVKEALQIELDELPLIYECLTIETSFGNTCVLVTGQENKPPLVLIYGINGCPPFALDLVIRLKDDFRVFAIDGMAQSTLNAETFPSVQNESYGQWMYEVLAWLNIRNAILLGISFGGFISWKTLLLDERHVSRAIFIVPAGFVNGGKWRILRKIWLPFKLYKWLKHSCLVRQVSKELFTDQNEEGLAFFPKWLFHSQMAFSPVPVITKEEAQKIKKPVHLIAAEKDVLFPGEKMLKRARAIFPTLGEVLLLKNSRHVPDRYGNEQIVDFIKKLTQ